MANPILDALSAQVKKTVDTEASAKLLIDGIAGKIAAAVTAAIAGGATAAELAPVSDLVTALQASSDALAADVVANS